MSHFCVSDVFCFVSQETKQPISSIFNCHTITHQYTDFWSYPDFLKNAGCARFSLSRSHVEKMMSALAHIRIMCPGFSTLFVLWQYCDKYGLEFGLELAMCMYTCTCGLLSRFGIWLQTKWAGLEPLAGQPWWDICTQSDACRYVFMFWKIIAKIL